MILIFGTIFGPTLKIPTQRGQKLTYLSPMVQSISRFPSFDLDIWGTYRWAMQMIVGWLPRYLDVVYAHVPILSYFHLGRPYHVPKVNIWGQNGKIQYIVPSIRARQMRHSSSENNSDYVF